MRIRLSVVVSLILVAGAVAQAGKPRSVHDAFAGRVLLSTAPLRATGATEAAMIEDFRKAAVDEVTSRDTGAAEASWHFHFTAFLAKPPRVSEMSLDVYTADDDRRYITSKRMMGIEPRLQILAGDMTLTEDDGVRPGAAYHLVLTGEVRGREVTFATAVVTLR